ncbi:MAG: HU family DNA-binding protein [Treponema sp.]|nr:HU family DNA-binding protein [Treponema sp.]
MNKSELITAIVERSTKDGVEITKKQADAFLKSFTAIVEETLVKGEDIQLIGFGTFTVVERAERTGRNPATKQTITIPASKSPKFKAGKALKDKVNAK